MTCSRGHNELVSLMQAAPLCVYGILRCQPCYSSRLSNFNKGDCFTIMIIISIIIVYSVQYASQLHVVLSA